MVSGGLLSPGKAKVRRMLEGKAEVEDDVLTEPIPMPSEAELKRELLEIGGLAADTKNPEWMKRVKALERFRGIIAGGAHTQPHFLSIMRECMREALNNAIQDLRSAVSKEACHAVTFMCKTLPPNVWESMSEWFINSLFKISVVTIAVISQSSSRCLRHILRHGKMSHRAVSVILDSSNFENKHATYRQTVYQAIFTVLHKMPSTEFSPRELGLVLRAVKQGITDPMPEVRKTARMMYWATYYMLPTRAEELFESWDQATQKNLLEEKAVYDGLTDAVAVNWETLARTPSKPASLSSSVLSEGPPPSSLEESQASHGTVKTRSSSLHGRRAGAATPTPGGSLRSATPVPVRNSSDSNSGTPTASAVRRSGTTAPRPCTPLSLKKQSLADNSSNGLTPSTTTTAASSPAISTHSNASSIRFKNAKAQPGKRTPNTASHADPSIEGLRIEPKVGRGAWGDDAPRSRAVQSTQPKKRALSASRGVPAMLAFTPLDVDAETDADVSHDSGAGLHDDVRHAGSVESIMSMEDRPQAMRKMAELMRGSGLREVRQKLPVVVRFLLQSMEDGRRNTLPTVCEAFDAFGTLAQSLQDTNALETHFEPVFLLIFPRLGDTATHNVALGLLEKLLECGQTRVLFPVLLRVLNSASDKVQLGCLEYILHLMQFSKEYLARSGPMDQGMSKFAHLSNSPNQDVKQASVTCLGVLYTVGPRVFCQEVLKRTASEQRHIKQSLGKTYPNLAEDLDSVSAGRDLSTASSTASPPNSLKSNGRGDSETPSSPLNRSVGRVSARTAHRTAPVQRRQSEDAAHQGSPLQPTHTAHTATRGKKVKKASSVGVLSKDQTLASSMTEKDTLAATARSPARRMQSSGRAKTPVSQAGGTVQGAVKVVAPPKARDGAAGGGESIASLVQCAASGARSMSERLAAAQKLQASASAATGVSDGVVLKYVAQLTPLLAQDAVPLALRITLLEASVTLASRVSPTAPTTALKELFSRLLLCYCDPEPKVSSHAEEGLVALLVGLPCSCSISLVTQEMMRQDPQNGQREEVPLLFRLLEGLIVRVGADSPQDLMDAAESFVALLYAGLGSERSDVRKAVVFCFVSIYVAVGSACVPLLKPLATSQLKLITIYINRRQGKSGTQVDLAALH